MSSTPQPPRPPPKLVSRWAAGSAPSAPPPRAVAPVVRGPVPVAPPVATAPVHPAVEAVGHGHGAGASGFGWIWLVLLIGVVGAVWWLARPEVPVDTVSPEDEVVAGAGHAEVDVAKPPSGEPEVAAPETGVIAEEPPVEASVPAPESSPESAPEPERETVVASDRTDPLGAEWMSPLLETQQAMRSVLDEQRRQGEALAERLAGLEATREVLAGLGEELAAARAAEAPVLEVPEAFTRDVERMEAEMARLREALISQREAMQSLTGRMEGLDTIARAARDLTRAMKQAPPPAPTQVPVAVAPGAAALPDALVETLARMNETVTSLRDDVLTHREVLMDLNAQVADLGRLPTNILYVSGVMTRHPTTVLYRSRVVLFPAKPEPAAPAPEPAAVPEKASAPVAPLVINTESAPEAEQRPEPEVADNPAARLDGPMVLSPASFGRQGATTIHANERYFSPTRTVTPVEDKPVYSPSDFTLP